ncbi:conserved hypothetical protein [Ricinus communis]|uniref:Uncharacterized protein n=1 Tax=Ricinus communis TaxID=3988 RepID=B9RPR0_RICCO|nr:conserved hypothetical protein [Ricinus communis]
MNKDTTYIELRVDKRVFYKLCEMLAIIWGLKPTKNMLVDEQKNRTTLINFQRSGETEGSTVDGRVLRDAISMTRGLKAISNTCKIADNMDILLGVTQKLHLSWQGACGVLKRKDAQGVEDILEEIRVMGDADVGNNEIESTHETSESHNDTSVTGTHGGRDIKEIGKEMSKNIEVELTIQQKAEELFGVLNEIGGLTMSEKFTALRKISKDPTQMLVFFSLPAEYRLRWVKEFLMDS